MRGLPASDGHLQRTPAGKWRQKILKFLDSPRRKSVCSAVHLFTPCICFHVAPERGGGVRHRRCRFSPCVLIFIRVRVCVGNRVFHLDRRVGSSQRPGASGRLGAGGRHSWIWQGPGVRLGPDQGGRRHGRIHGVSCDHQGSSCFLSMCVLPWSGESTCSFYLLVVLSHSYTCNTRIFHRYKSSSVCRSSRVPLAFSLSTVATLTLNGCTIN
jgi:hypothetical protein